MKIAVCFYGQTRTAKFAANNLKKYFGNLINDIDIFTHTWDVRMDRPLGMLRTTFNEPVKIDAKNLEDYRVSYPHKDFLVEDQIQLRHFLQKKYGVVGVKTVSEMTYPYHSFYRSMQFKKQYEEMHNFKYDIVIKLRPDVIFPADRLLEYDIDEFLKDPSKLYICYHDDVFHIGTSEIMDIASDFYIKTDVLYHSNGLPFDAFTSYMQEKDIPIVKMGDCRFTVLRHELTHLEPISHYHEICYLNSLLYSEVFYHLRYSWKWWYNSNNAQWKEDMYYALEKTLHPDDLQIIMNNHLIDV